MKVFVTRKIPGNALTDLSSAGFDVEVSEFSRALTQEELVNKVKGIDALLCLISDRVDGDLMDTAGPQLKIISNYGVGFDNIDTLAASNRQILVANTPSDEVNEAVAEHTWALIFSLARRIVEADEAVRNGAYKGWEPDLFLGIGLKGKTLGIVGLGRIGSMVAKRARGYDMTVLYNKRSPDPSSEKELGVIFSSMEDLLAKSDFLTLHVPLTDDTRGMINAEVLGKMKQGSYLINTARGQIVKEHDLVQALKSGHLGGSGLDVFENEPNIHPELIGMENVVLTPHIASATNEAREKMGEMAVKAIIDAASNKKPENLVNQEVWEKRRK